MTVRKPERAPSRRNVFARTSRDFFSALMQHSQADRAQLLEERELWLRSIQVDGREELLFEFEMLLRGVERYFNLQNLPLDTKDRPALTHDFSPELHAVRDAVNEAIKIARRLLDPDTDQKMVFRKYVKSQVSDDRVRRLMTEEEFDQDSPQESLFVLRQSFDALRTVLDHLLKLPVLGLSLFSDIGHLALREVVESRYFRPFRPLEFRLEYDRIKSVRVLEALRELPERDRRVFTLSFLALFRILHYLSYLTADEEEELPERSSVLFALTRSELNSLVGYLREEGVELTSRAHKSAALKAARDLAKGSLSSGREVSDAEVSSDAISGAAVELTALVRATIERLARALSPDLPEKETFRALVNRVEMAERLRLDLFVLAQLCREVHDAAKADGQDGMEEALEGLSRFIRYFHDVSYQLLRYGDYDAFDRFVEVLAEAPDADAPPETHEAFAETMRVFAGVVETTYAAVSRRADLEDRPLNRTAAEALHDNYSYR